MEGMREIATAYYQRSTDREKEAAEAFFRQLDSNGDGHVTLADLKRSSVPSWVSNENVFRQLDGDGDGTLDFSDALPVYYIVKKLNLMVCNGCWGLLSGAYFSCRLCLGKGKHTFDLCCGCYRRGNVAHEHSVHYLMDHHSLLSELRRRATDAETSRNKEMEELREIAMAHYHAGSPQVQALAYDFYRSMDTNGDGTVSLTEFLGFMKHQGYWQMRNPHFFRELDQDGNGTLSFSEVMTLYYIIKSGRPFCDACGHFIPGTFFSCIECFKAPEASFNLCRHCYRSAKCSHNHGGRTQFLDNYTLLEATRDLGLAQATGVVSSVERSPMPPNTALVPAAPNYIMVPVMQQTQTHAYMNPSYPAAYSMYAAHPPPSPVPNYTTAVVPANPSNKWEKCRVALKALEVALSIGGTVAPLCTIL